MLDVSGYQTSPGLQSTAIGSVTSRSGGVRGVARTMMSPSSDADRSRAPSAVPNPGRALPHHPAQARVEGMAAGSQRAKLVSVVDQPVDGRHDLGPDPSSLEIGPDGDGLDVAGAERRLARIQKAVDDRRVSDDASCRILGQDVNAGTDVLPVGVPGLVERRNAQIGQDQPLRRRQLGRAHDPQRGHRQRRGRRRRRPGSR